MATTEKILHIAGENYEGIKTLQIPTSDSLDATQSNGGSVKFLDTSDGTAALTDIVAGKTTYGVNADGENDLVTGKMLPLDVAVSEHASPSSVYLQQHGVMPGSSGYFIPTGTWTFDKTKFDAIPAGSTIEQTDLEFTLSDTEIDSIIYTGIRFVKGFSSSMSQFEFYNPTSNKWVMAAQSSGNADGWQWNPTGSFVITPNPIVIKTLPSAGLNYDFYNFLMTTASPTDNTDMRVYIKMGANAYIPGTDNYIQAFAIPGLATLQPNIIKKDVIIQGLLDSSGQSFKGTLAAADIKRLSDDSSDEGYKTLVIQ